MLDKALGVNSRLCCGTDWLAPQCLSVTGASAVNCKHPVQAMKATTSATTTTGRGLWSWPAACTELKAEIALVRLCYAAGLTATPCCRKLESATARLRPRHVRGAAHPSSSTSLCTTDALRKARLQQCVRCERDKETIYPLASQHRFC